MRWLIRKVVEFVLEALEGSDRFDKILDRLSEKIGRSSPVVTSLPRESDSSTGVNRAVDDDDDSQKAIVNMIIASGNKVEMSDVAAPTTVTEADDDRKEIMDLMKNI
jgi:hypothetical protein